MKILITGTSQGIGKAIAGHFIAEGHEVIGVDRQEAAIVHDSYVHHVCDIRNIDDLPDLPYPEILINNAGTQNENDIDTNLKALIRITEKYGVFAKGYKVDPSVDEEALITVFDDIKAEGYLLDCIVLNAANLGIKQEFLTVSVEDFSEVIYTNVVN